MCVVIVHLSTVEDVHGPQCGIDSTAAAVVGIVSVHFPGYIHVAVGIVDAAAAAIGSVRIHLSHCRHSHIPQRNIDTAAIAFGGMVAIHLSVRINIHIPTRLIDTTTIPNFRDVRVNVSNGDGY